VPEPAELNRTAGPAGFRRSWHTKLPLAWLIVAALFLITSLTAYLVDLAVHPNMMLTWYDLNVYNDAGLITRQLPSILYSWQLSPGIGFTYTPFAAVLFAAGSLLPWVTLRWSMTVVGLVCVPLTVWLTLGGLGRRGLSRAAVAFAVSALALWTEPVMKSLLLGQIEPLLLLLVVWDLTRSDQRKWKGAGIGLAAGIKLVPLIFIPYLLLAGKIRQAAVATATFAATIVIGFIALPRPSVTWWLTGYFIRPGRTGGVASLVNQSLLGMLARQFGGMNAIRPVWLPIDIAVALIGVAAGALMTRTGRQVQGWTTVGLTSVLVSPISWDHHWVWIVPFLAMLAGLAMQARVLARLGYLAAMLATAGIFGNWPSKYSGPLAFVPRNSGLLAWFLPPQQIDRVTRLTGVQLLTWNLFVIVGCVGYLVMLIVAWRVWRSRPARPVRPGNASDTSTAADRKADAGWPAGHPALAVNAGSYRRAGSRQAGSCRADSPVLG